MLILTILARILVVLLRPEMLPVLDQGVHLCLLDDELTLEPGQLVLRFSGFSTCSVAGVARAEWVERRGDRRFVFATLKCLHLATTW